jgi:hypothetical protein
MCPVLQWLIAVQQSGAEVHMFPLAKDRIFQIPPKAANNYLIDRPIKF